MSLEHYTHAKKHLSELETLLLNMFDNPGRLELLLKLTELQIAAGRLALELGIQNAAPVMPEPAPKTTPKSSSQKPAVGNKPNSSLPMYDHVNIKDDQLFSDGKRKLLFVIGKKYFQLEGPALESRLLEAASKITQKSVAYLDRLNYKDGNKILEEIKTAAIANGSFVEGAR
jgi:hypothetical protein